MKKNLIIVIVILAVLAGGAYLVFGKVKVKEKVDDCALTPWIPACAGMTRSGAGATQAKPGEVAENIIPAPTVAAEAIAEISAYKYTETYAGPANGFSFKYPKDFTVSEMPSEESQVILAQNIAKNIGAQIVISPFDGADVDITAEYIKAAIPDMKIGEPRVVQIGANRQGLAFKSDNEAFGGDSREIWFVTGGRFYQLTAYAQSGEFLDGLFRTWKIE